MPTGQEFRELNPREFVRKLGRILRRKDATIVWFLGAGCSYSSRIPTAADLVRQWLPQLKESTTSTSDRWEDWATATYPQFRTNPALLYGSVMEQLFELPIERQLEIERLTSGKDPAYGYAVLAKLMAHPDYGKACNVVLTTNFDDLVADALYLFTDRKPLVVVHELLARFVERNEARPLVVKLHGDARLEPRNVPAELEKVDRELRSEAGNILRNAGLVFLGYGGNDNSIADLLDKLKPDTLRWGIYWVGAGIPDGPVGRWLGKQRNVYWVKHRDFDELMLYLGDELSIGQPKFDRFERLLETYERELERLRGRAREPAVAEEASSGELADRAVTVLAAYKTVQEARSQRDSKAADELFRGALKLAPNDTFVLRSYANFVTDILQEHDRAEDLYKRILRQERSSAALNSYATFLWEVRADMDRAERLYAEAVEAKPVDINALSNFGTFLWEVRGDVDRAEQLYRRAVDAGPARAASLGSLATFLWQARGELDRAEELYIRALDLDPANVDTITVLAAFLSDARDELDRSEELYRRAVQLKPDNPGTLGAFATFLWKRRGDREQAEELYRQALAIRPTSAIELANHAQMLFAFGERDEAEAVMTQAAAAGPDKIVQSELLFYQYAHLADRRAVALRDLRVLIGEGIRSLYWDLEPTIERASLDGHPELDLLRALGAVLTKDASASRLERYAAWRAAVAAAPGVGS
jgi:Tfp pilus assembly protein PilF